MFVLSVFYVCTFFIICILCLYYLYFMFVPFLLSVFYVCIICILCLYLFYYLYFMFVLSVFYVCTYIFYTYIYCYVAIGEHWHRLFWSKVNISENCIFIFSFNFFQLSQKHHFWLISLDLMEGFVSNFGHKSL